MKHTQIERLRALKKRIIRAQQRHDGRIEAAVVLVGVAELVGILLMEVEDYKTAGDPSTFRLTDDGVMIFSERPLPFEVVYKAIEAGLKVRLQHYDGRTVTFKRVPEEALLPIEET